ncbi:MAG: translation initiation factor IF-5A [Nanoarchaeota archaeon]
MAFKLVNATELKTGSHLIIEGEAYVVKSMDISKTGKHGASKCRFEAISVITGKKKVMVVPGHERFEVPMIEKRRAQVLSIMNDKVSVMDSESFENFELSIPEELKAEIKDGVNVEYWDVEGQKIIKRIV